MINTNMSVTGTYKVIQLGSEGQEVKELIFNDENPIHFDDSIDTIKTKIILKLLQEAEAGSNKYNKKNMYLFCKRKTELFSSAVIETLTRKGSRSKIKDTEFSDFFKNIDSYCDDEDNDNCSPFIQPVIDKNSSKLDLEVLQMRLDGKKYIVDEVLGRKNTILQYPIVVCNPLKKGKLLENDPFSLLLDSGPIVENTIYLYFLRESPEEEEEDSSNVIKSGDDFQKYNMKFDKINQLYSLYRDQPKIKDLTDVSGITMISLSIKPEANYLSVSTENLFKIIHATKKNPLVAYRPYKKANLVYRLYSAQKTKEDIKVPVIQIPAMNIIELFINKNKDDDSVFILIKYGEEKKKEIYCQISSSFEITITCKFTDNSINSVNDINDLIRENVNPLLQSISRFFERVGYKLSMFTSLEDTDRVKINELSYTYVYKGAYDFKRTLSFDAIFQQDNDNIRYKRVSGGEKDEEDEGFITVFEEIQKHYEGTNITEKRLTINSIDDINYLDVLPIYLKSLAVQHLLTAEEMQQISDRRGGSSPDVNFVSSSSSNSSSSDNPLDVAESSASTTTSKEDDEVTTPTKNVFEEAESEEKELEPAPAATSTTTAAIAETKKLKVTKKVKVQEKLGQAIKEYLIKTGNKFEDTYVRNCQSGRIPIILSHDALQELQARDESFKEEGRVLNEGENNFVCKYQEYKYPRFDELGRPCCHKKLKERNQKSSDKSYVNKFSGDNTVSQGHWSSLPAVLSK
jgi:hypothetical protein